MEANAQSNDQPEFIILSADKMAATAALDPGLFTPVNVTEPVPKAWEDRAIKAWEFYTTEPIVSNVVNTWLAFAVGDDIKVACDDEAVQKAAEDAFWRLRMDAWVRDMTLQLLVKGDAVGYMRLSKEQTDIAEALCLNPASCKVTYTDGELQKVVQFDEVLSGMSTLSEGTDLPLEQVTHRKWNAPGFAQRGNSMVLPAFQAIELLRSYRKAEQAIAKRWTTPLRFIKVGGKFGDKLIMPDQGMLQTIRDQVNKMDLRSGMVVPFWVTAETFGTEGHVLDTEAKVKEIKEDIVVALGLAKSLVTGDGPNYATASVSLRKMLIQVRQIRQAARELLNWVFDRWLALRGWQDKSLTFGFSDINIDEQVEQKKLLLEMYDRGLVSGKSVQVLMELNPEIENEHRKTEQVSEKSWSVAEVLQMVQLGILDAQSAQELLGIDAAKVAARTSEAGHDDIERLYTKAQHAAVGKMCDDCLHFDEDRNRCRAQDIDVAFDTPACVLFERDRSPETGDGSHASSRSSPPASSLQTPVSPAEKTVSTTASPTVSAHAGPPDGDSGGGDCGCGSVR